MISLNNNLKAASEAVCACSTGEQMKNSEKNNGGLLYDLCDLANIFKVTKRTLFNWQAKNQLPLINFGGKLYLSHDKLMEMILLKEGGVQ